MRIAALEIAAATGGSLVGDDVVVDGAAYDSRTLRPEQLFVPLIADRDGHDFISAAIAAGAPLYLSSRGRLDERASAIIVDDTLRALMALATHLRARVPGPVVGVTGSVGKTSTKDLLRAALGSWCTTWANEASFNNDFGLPTTLVNTPDDAHAVVVEMGMRGFGEIARLCSIARPTVGVVTRVAEAHSERLGGLDGIARAKAELVEALPANGVAILNADDPRVAAMSARTSARVVTYGTDATASVRIGQLDVDDAARASFTASTPWGHVTLRLSQRGAHMAWNAAAALATVGALGGDLERAAVAISAVPPGERRMDLRRSASGGTVIDDSYNANPTSMRAGLDALHALDAARRVAVLGVMAEIDDAAREHRAIADYARERDIEVLAVGTDLYGVAPVADVVEVLAPLGEGTAVLVKGSNIAGLGTVAAALIAR